MAFHDGGVDIEWAWGMVRKKKSERKKEDERDSLHLSSRGRVSSGVQPESSVTVSCSILERDRHVGSLVGEVSNDGNDGDLARREGRE